MNRKAALFSLLVWLCCAVLLIAEPAPAAMGVQEALSLCAETLLPSLFPFLVLTALMLNLGLEQKTLAVFHTLFPRSRISGDKLCAVLLGVLGGYPAGAASVAALYQKKRLSEKEAIRTLAVSNNPAPAFVFGVMGGLVFHSTAAAAFLYGVQLLAGLLYAFLTGTAKRDAAQPVFLDSAFDSVPFSSAFSAAVMRSGWQAVQICMFVTVFSVLNGYLQQFLCYVLPGDASMLLSGLLEISVGAKALAAVQLPFKCKLMAASFYLSFGGFCVQAQGAAICRETGLVLNRFPAALLQKALLSSALTAIFLLLMPERSVWQENLYLQTSAFPSAVSSFSFLALSFFFCFFQSRGRNSDKQRV